MSYKKFILFNLAAFVALLPAVSLAQTIGEDGTLAAGEGFVACSGTTCSACHLVVMANTIIRWLMGMVAILFAVMAAVAGWGLITSGGNSGAKEAAKKKFVNVIIGLLIVLGAWLLVDTIMLSLTGQQAGSWSEVECGSQATTNEVRNPIREVQANLTGVGRWDTTATGTAATGGSPNSSCAGIEDCAQVAQECIANGGGTPVVNGNPPSSVTCNPPAPETLPESTGACAPLSPADESSQGLNWSNTDPRLRACVARKGGSPTSAYRSPTYQAHLREIHTKWCSQGLQGMQSQCPDVYAEVQGEMSRHGLSCSRPVARNSNHSSGIAVDISGAPRDDSHCLTWFGPGDPVHYTLRAGCSCN